MLHQTLATLTVATRGRAFYEVTADVQDLVRKAAVGTGLCTLHIKHTSASLLIQENADPDVQRDFEKFFARLVPDGDRLFVHTVEGADDMPAHIRAALTQTSIGIPLRHGKLALGTWQGIYLFEHRDAPHRREVLLHLLGD